MVKTAVMQALGESRSFQTRHGSRVAIVGGGLLGTLLSLRFRQAGRLVTVFEASDRVERRGHATVDSRDRALLELLDELDLAHAVRWEVAPRLGLRLGSLTGGRARIIEALRDRARALDVDQRWATCVRAITTDMSGFFIEAGSETGEFDEVVLTVPAPIASEMLPALPDHERRLLLDMQYLGLIEVSFVVKRTRPSRYVSQVIRGHDRFTLIAPAALGAQNDSTSVIYVTRTMSSADSPLLRATDRTVIEDFARALPGTADIVMARVMRSPYAFAARHSPSLVTTIPGFSLVTASHLSGGHHYIDRTAALASTVFRTLCAEPII